MKTEQISVKAKFQTENDERALHELAKYCTNLRLNMETVQVNDDIVVLISGRADNLFEIKEHLEKVAQR